MAMIKLTPAPIQPKTINAYDMKTGQIGRSAEGRYYLRTADSVISLSNPEITCNSPFGSPNVERLKPGDVLSITVGFEPEVERRIRALAVANKIQAIKEVRELTNWGLKEAKEYVDSF